ncbi:MAG: ribokinase [Firmicutes bacterium]|nr:ribokinase [Bacillota bacterium]
MKILNFGSCNLDYVYRVEHIVREGETLSASSRAVFPGGKGLNQSIAITRAGGTVWHAGRIGPEGTMLRALCEEAGVRTDFLEETDVPTGHTVIQVDAQGQNSILVFGGANQSIDSQMIERVLLHFGAGDLLVLQNEISNIPELVERASALGMQIACNPSPWNAAAADIDLSKITLLFINEVEGEQITGTADPKEMLKALGARYPDLKVVLTLGSQGSCCLIRGHITREKGFPVTPVDTTGAGDTYTGYFLRSYAAGMPIAHAMRLASMAAAISVTRPGAVPSIPRLSEVMAKYS